MFCDHMGVDDLNEVIPALRQMGEKNANHLKMKKVIDTGKRINTSCSLLFLFITIWFPTSVSKCRV